MSDTPRTDEVSQLAVHNDSEGGYAFYEMRAHARQLERELAELKQMYGAACIRLQALGEKEVPLVASASGAPKIPKFAAELWDEGEYVITVNGTPWGSTVPKHAAGEIARWLTHNFVLLVASTDIGGN